MKITAIDTVSEFTGRSATATVSEGLAQGSCMASRAGFEPTTLRSKGIDSTNAQPRPTKSRTDFMTASPKKGIINVSFIHAFILNIYIAPLQENYSEALPTPARSNKAVLR